MLLDGQRADEGHHAEALLQAVARVENASGFWVFGIDSVCEKQEKNTKHVRL